MLRNFKVAIVIYISPALDIYLNLVTWANEGWHPIIYLYTMLNVKVKKTTRSGRNVIFTYKMKTHSFSPVLGLIFFWGVLALFFTSYYLHIHLIIQI